MIEYGLSIVATGGSVNSHSMPHMLDPTEGMRAPIMRLIDMNGTNHQHMKWLEHIDKDKHPWPKAIDWTPS